MKEVATRYDNMQACQKANVLTLLQVENLMELPAPWIIIAIRPNRGGTITL